MNRKLLALFAGGVLTASPLLAHHSFTATYDESAVVEIEGTLVSFMFRNPHSFVHLMAPDENGEMQRWAVEWGAAGALDRQGLSRDTLRVGDQVVITGNPGRNTLEHRVRMQTLIRPNDGFGWGLKPGETFD
jgi:thiamine monophosphate kinase